MSRYSSIRGDGGAYSSPRPADILQPMLLPDFQHQTLPDGDGALHFATSGSGPPLLLLHGFPVSHVAWHAVAPLLARSFSVVCPDLPGYGASHKPAGTTDHATYSKRTWRRRF